MIANDFAPTLRGIVARASFIHERRAPEFTPDLTNDQQIQAHLKAWLEAVSEERDRARLERLWEWDGIREPVAREMVAPVTLQADAPLPRWAELLQEILQAPPLPLKEGTLVTADPLPFQEVLAPFVGYAQREFAAVNGYELLTPEAQAQLGRSLLKTLSSFAAESLLLEFQAVRNRQPFGGLAALVAKSAQTPQDTLYKKFVAQMAQGGFYKFLEKYPVLARILGTFTLLNIETRRRFLNRLAGDTAEIARVFHKEAPLGKVQTLALALSDLHRGGDSVTAVTFESGLRLVYKPKDLATELAFNDLLRWINARSNALELLPLEVLNRGTHGWVTFAEHTACADKAAVARYYQRIGMLLALMYALEATDCHYENLIASGEHPVLIDHETLFHHRVPEETDEELRDSAILRAVEDLTGSVLRVGLLPGWTIGKDRRVAYDASGLGGYGGQRVPFQRLTYIRPNTDAMERKLQMGVLANNPNIPELGGAPAQLEDYAEDIVVGFRTMYDFLLNQRAALLAEDGPLHEFRQAQVRFVFRATQVYASLQAQAQQPAYLRDGAAYSISLERLARAFLQLDHKPTSFPLLNAERRDLAQLDTPFFTARTDSADLLLDLHSPTAGDEPSAVSQIKHYFSGPSFALASERIAALSPRDLAWQVTLIERSLQMRFATEGYTAQVKSEDKDASATPANRIQIESANVDLVAAAVGLGQELVEYATQGKDGSVVWVGPSYMPESGRYQLAITGVNTYDGLTGVALFSAALARVTGDPKWRELSYGCLKMVRDSLGKEFNEMVRGVGIGGAAGLGSIVYAMTRVGMLLDDPALIEEALVAVRKLTPAQIQADTSLDVIGGSAGAILSLLAVYDSTGEPAALERARDAGLYLLGKREPATGGKRAWRSIMARPLTGFSHGAAGFSLALARLYAHTGDEEFRTAAAEAIQFEDLEFDPKVENWHDMRDMVNDAPYNPEQPRFANAWCHGAPGIGLARVGMLDTLDNAQMRSDIEAALHFTENSLQKLDRKPDHLCCGNVGCIELLWSAGQKLDRPDLQAEARGFAKQIVLNAAERGGYKYSTFTPRGVFAPGLFVGASGIGYEFLRLAAPGVLPNLLLWE